MGIWMIFYKNTYTLSNFLKTCLSSSIGVPIVFELINLYNNHYQEVTTSISEIHLI